MDASALQSRPREWKEGLKGDLSDTPTPMQRRKEAVSGTISICTGCPSL